MAWQEPKIDWGTEDGVTADDFNRIEGNIQHLQDTKETPAGAQAKAEAAAGAVQAELDAHKSDKANPHNVTKAQIGLGNVQNYGIATQAEAEAGSINNKYMTPLRTRQAIEKVMSTIGGGTKVITSPTEPEGLATGDQWHREI